MYLLLPASHCLRVRGAAVVCSLGELIRASGRETNRQRINRAALTRAVRNFERSAADIHRAIVEPGEARNRVLCGRQDRHPGPRPQGPGAAAVPAASGPARISIVLARVVEPGGPVVRQIGNSRDVCSLGEYQNQPFGMQRSRSEHMQLPAALLNSNARRDR